MICLQKVITKSDLFVNYSLRIILEILMKIVGIGSINHAETGPNYFINTSETIHRRLSNCSIVHIKVWELS